jgi:anionic cell wall polymer biosynthesis LytR-Cps2A-Psr (LCP) family protein
MGRGFACRVGRIAVAARGDLDRIRREQVFLASMAHRMLATNILTDPDALERLMAALRASVTVDDLAQHAGHQSCTN